MSYGKVISDAIASAFLFMAIIVAVLFTAIGIRIGYWIWG